MQSALEQNYNDDLEVIIINDGSTDHTEQYLKWLEGKKDSRIKIIRTAMIGRSAARNIGNEQACGEMIFVLDADDLAAPNRLELTVKKKLDTGADFIYGSATIIDCTGKKIGEVRADVFNRDRALDTKLNHIVHSSVAYTKEFAKQFPYNEGELSSLGLDDWGQQITAAIAGIKMDFVPQTICAYRHLESGISKTRNEKEVAEAKDRYLDSLKTVA